MMQLIDAQGAQADGASADSFDVCAVLGYENSRQALGQHCESDGVSKRYIITGGKHREVQVINEGNL